MWEEEEKEDMNIEYRRKMLHLSPPSLAPLPLLDQPQLHLFVSHAEICQSVGSGHVSGTVQLSIRNVQGV